ncbi:hypothetical protein F2Q69_00034468 [Brassica cretica]|uniref:Uncharacterized protein n=1 Tax=Brassica cretica TaxID=69181 RepID=A0A8S9SEP5_BRACR|nr:hypothetical protein F2Q69_00034468 [Brassica cretica]
MGRGIWWSGDCGEEATENLVVASRVVVMGLAARMRWRSWWSQTPPGYLFTPPLRRPQTESLLKYPEVHATISRLRLENVLSTEIHHPPSPDPCRSSPNSGLEPDLRRRHLRKRKPNSVFKSQEPQGATTKIRLNRPNSYLEPETPPSLLPSYCQIKDEDRGKHKKKNLSQSHGGDRRGRLKLTALGQEKRNERV